MKFQQRFAAFGLVVGCLFLGPAFAKADTVFNVSGQFSFPGAGTFSGTLTVNTGSGTLDGINIMFPRELPFNTIYTSLPADNYWTVVATDYYNDELALGVSTSPGTASLVGLTSGTIVNGTVLTASAGGAIPLYANFSGNITPAAPLGQGAPAVPEPSSLVLLSLGSFGLLTFWLARRAQTGRDAADLG